MGLLVINLLVLLGLTAAQGFFSYDGYKVYQITTTTSAEVDLLTVFEDDQRFDFWSKHRTHKVPHDVMVSPTGQDEFEGFLNEHAISYTVLIENYEDIVEKERQIQGKSKVVRGEVTFTEYMRHDEISAYLYQLAEEYPDIVTTEVIGRSFESRDIVAIKISSGAPNSPAIFADAGIHAREWISPTSALYIINQLVENPENSNFYQDVDWIFIPVANPDGYEFTHTNERMWRKTRTPGTICHGVDPNRNFDFHWGESGSSTWQCSEAYGGREAFTEVESLTVANYLLAHAHHVRLYVAIHSYGNWVLYPWSYAIQYPDNSDELQDVGDIFNDAAFEAGSTRNYTVGNSAYLLGATAGCSDDYAKAVAGVDLSYTLELPGGGSQGFNPPATSILPVGHEVWEGFKALHQYVQTKYSKSSA